MKAAPLLLLLSMPALGQDADNSKIVPFNRADTEHCKVTPISGGELLETTFDGTSVAISLPTAMPDGEFQMYVAVRQIGPGSVEIKPKDFGVLYSDPAHTRFPFYDKAATIGLQGAAARARASDSGVASESSQVDKSMPGTPPPPGSLNSNAYTGMSRTVTGRDPNAPARQQEEAREQQQKISRPDDAFQSGKRPEFLYPSVVQQGASVSGLVFFKKPKGFKMKSGQQDVLYQIDIPVNGMIFRFR